MKLSCSEAFMLVGGQLSDNANIIRNEILILASRNEHLEVSIGGQ